MAGVMSDDWSVTVATEQDTATIYVGGRDACKDLAARIVGRTLMLICSGGAIESGTISKAWASPTDPKARGLRLNGAQSFAFAQMKDIPSPQPKRRS